GVDDEPVEAARADAEATDWETPPSRPGAEVTDTDPASRSLDREQNATVYGSGPEDWGATPASSLAEGRSASGPDWAGDSAVAPQSGDAAAAGSPAPLAGTAAAAGGAAADAGAHRATPEPYEESASEPDHARRTRSGAGSGEPSLP